MRVPIGPFTFGIFYKPGASHVFIVKGKRFTGYEDQEETMKVTN
jgi:hypothetical protein